MPSERHSSQPWTPSSAKNKSVPPTFVGVEWDIEVSGPGSMSRTSRVPFRVPSERHNSWPWVLSPTTKNGVRQTPYPEAGSDHRV